ncbi:putative LTR retrotransposon, partial [Pseudoloma neurophilia]
FHDTKDCNFLKAQQQNRNPTDKNLAINDAKSNKNDLIYMPFSSENHEINAIIDTGSKHSFIHSKMTKKLNRLSEKMPEPITVQFGNGETQIITHYIKLDISPLFDQTKHMKETTFLISDILPCDCIIGLNFMIKHAVSINVWENKLTFGHCEIETKNNILSTAKPDCLNINDILQNKKNQVDRILEKLEASKDNIGTIKNSIFKIELNNDNPVQCSEYPVPLSEREKLKDHLNKLMKQKIIDLSDSNFSSPAFTKKKPDGDIRLLIDYRKLNVITKTQPYPFPSIKEQFLDLRGSTHFTLLDLKQGYYQVPIYPPDTKKQHFQSLAKNLSLKDFRSDSKTPHSSFKRQLHTC